LRPPARGGGGTVPTIDLSLGAVRLHIGTQGAGPFEVEIVASHGESMKTFAKVSPRDGEVTITVDDLPPGSYRVLLIAKRQQGIPGESVEEFTVQVGKSP